MQSYYISQSNSYTFRTQPTASTLNEFTMSLTDMTTLETFTASMTDITYEGYESYIGFTASISGTNIGEEYRATIINSGSTEPIWNGSIQVYASSSAAKSVYENQNTQYISNVTENRYIIMD
jgi:hypothetical protein